VYTPPLEEQQSRDSETNGLVFMTELSVLMETSYFIGTFNSNVGGLTTVLRACPERHHDPTHHYANSYGVDTEDWYFH
jgi:hypothetical protein